jgi:hypothetical protein
MNELANGDAEMFVYQNYNNAKKINNAITQILISIYSFHCEGYLHNDSHWGNFLYHKIKPGGYIKYIINGKELYLENIGYLWVIWDFGNLVTHFDKYIGQIAKDYMVLLASFENVSTKSILPEKLRYSPLEDEFPYSPSTITYVSEISQLLNNSINNPYDDIKNNDATFFDAFIKLNKVFITKEDLSNDAVIINKNNPYKIGL